MSFPAGTRIGPYEVDSLLGAGGMGEVLSRDTQLGRSVAIKVLPAAFALDPERIDRFIGTNFPMWSSDGATLIFRRFNVPFWAAADGSGRSGPIPHGDANITASPLT